MDSSDSKRQKLEDLYSYSLEELYSMLAKEHPESRHLRLGTKESIEIGKRLFIDLHSVLHQKICIEWDYCSKRENVGLQDTISLISEVADLAAAISIGIPPFTISVILVKLGLSSFCECK